MQQKPVSGKLPKYLYHYTSEEGLFGILSTRQLHATAYYHLDDPTELKYAIKRLQERMKARKLNIKLNYPITSSFIKNIDFNVAVFSLSTEENLLSQWRAYCRNGGYAIGFNYQQLDSVLSSGGKQHNELHLLSCIYDNDEQNDEIDNYLNQIMSQNNRVINLNDFIVHIGLRLKHPCFKEEHEWRIISDIISPIFNATNKKYRIEWKDKVSHHRFAPYMAIELDSNYTLPIFKIRVGPFGNVNALTKLAKQILLKYKIQNCTVNRSRIPTRT